MTIKLADQYLSAIPDKRTSTAMLRTRAIDFPIASAVTQLTSRTTGVAVATSAGSITTNNTSLAAETSAAFVVTCPTVAIGDVVLVCQRSGAVGLMTSINVSAVAAGSFTINILNNNAAAGTAETGAIVISYTVVRVRV